MRINELGVLSDERELQRLKSELALATADKSRSEAALSSAIEEVHLLKGKLSTGLNYCPSLLSLSLALSLSLSLTRLLCA